MKKIIFTLLFVLISVLPLAASAGVPEAVTYLKTQTLDDWIAQGLVAAGETVDATPLKTFSGSSATDYAKRILALVAAGKNPTNYTGTDLVVGLKSFVQSDQIGDIALTNDDSWGIMALRSAGVPANDVLIKSSAQFLLDNQNSDGGWSWSVGFDSDTNDTAAVLMALVEAGYTISNSAIQDAVDYLLSQQNTDAGFAYQLPCFWPGCEASDSASTSWSISALNKLGLNAASYTKAGKSPQDFLLTLQAGDGSFKWQAVDASGSAAMTAYALVALANKSYPVARGFYAGGNSTGPTPLADLDVAFNSSELTAQTGEELNINVKLVNRGPTMAQSVAAEFKWPEELELVRAVPSAGTFNKEKNQWQFIRLNNYAEAELVLTFITQQEAQGNISAAVSAKELDFNLTNNESVVNLIINQSEPVILPEIIEESAPQVLGEFLYSCEPEVLVSYVTAWSGFIVSPNDSLTPWYVDKVSGKPYCLTDSVAAYRALEIFGLGITNDDLAKIPVGLGEIDTAEFTEADAELVDRLRGRILLQVENLGEAWYVNPADGRRYYLADGTMALAKMAGWHVTLP